MSDILNSAVTAHSSTPGNQWQYFELGVKLTMARWTALRMAMEGEWGGGNIKRKYEVLMEEILHLFKYQKLVQFDHLAVNIEDYIESEFGLVCEDGSVDEVSKILVALATECKQGDFTRVRKLNDQFQTTSFAIDLKQAKINEEQEFLQRPEAGVERIEMQVDDTSMIDEDGFQTVRRSSRKKVQPKFFDPEVQFPGAQ
jgi:pre-rRNA-processing protein TSR2